MGRRTLKSHNIRRPIPSRDHSHVIISGQYHNVDAASSNFTAKLVQHPRVLAWFVQNIDLYGGEQAKHPKVHPFAYGLKTVLPSARKAHRNPIPHYQNLIKTLEENPVEKTKLLFVSYHRPTDVDRQTVPNGRKLDYISYLKEMARSKYVLSPNGDRPETHRTYEAIGLGTIPITSLNPFLHRHLVDGPVLYNQTNWTISAVEKRIQDFEKTHQEIEVNRNIIFEEYWIEYVDRIVGRELTWWDRCTGQPAMRRDFAPSCNVSNTFRNQVVK